MPRYDSQPARSQLFGPGSVHRLCVLPYAHCQLQCAFLTSSATKRSTTQKVESIRQGVLSPLLVRPLTDQSFEIVAGARRYRAAQMAETPMIPVRVVNLTDAEALEAQLIENLQRRDVHPLEEAQGFKALLNLEDPQHSIEQIAAKVGKHPAYCAALCG